MPSTEGPAQNNRIGRPVRVTSIGFRPGLPLADIAALVDVEASLGADLIILPETCRGQDKEARDRSAIETLEGPTVRALAPLARKHRTYVVCPIDRTDGRRRLNSAVIFDRSGEIACVYDKLYPFFGEECVLDVPVDPGENVQVFTADFGKVGVAICFDVNWPHLWRGLAERGAELVVWPSAYSAGRALQAHAIENHYPIVSATWIPDCRVFDIDGEELLHHHCNFGESLNVTRTTIDLDRCIFHYDFHYPGKLDKLMAERGEDVEVAKWLPSERWFVLQAKRPGASARTLAREYGLEELTNYIARTGPLIDERRAQRAAG